MVRDFVKNKKLSRTDYKTTVKAVVGMGVVKDYANKTVSFPTEETATDIFVINKERVPYGVDCARTDFSDYEAIFMNVDADSYVKLEQFEAGDSFGVDQISETDAPTAGDMVAVGTDGLWKKATVASPYKYVKDYVDNGHTLKLIEVLEVAKTND